MSLYDELLDEAAAHMTKLTRERVDEIVAQTAATLGIDRFSLLLALIFSCCPEQIESKQNQAEQGGQNVMTNKRTPTEIDQSPIMTPEEAKTIYGMVQDLINKAVPVSPREAILYESLYERACLILGMRDATEQEETQG
jgi:hypothetical protein